MREMITTTAKKTLRKLVPLHLRQRLCIGLNRCDWITGDLRYWWTRELLRDYAEQDRDEYHRFLWSNHLAYSLTYEVDQRFGEDKIVASRKDFISDLKRELQKMGIVPESDVRSAFEVGCSLGYQLRYFETDLFPSATDLAGIDIDRYAIEQGKRHLASVKSNVRLECADMAQLDELLKDRIYDVIVCTGVLMYLLQEDAALVVDAMLKHSRILVALSDPGFPEFDNGLLESSRIREYDGSRFHNIDAMVNAAGGSVLFRRWEGNRPVEGQRPYVVFAQK